MYEIASRNIKARISRRMLVPFTENSGTCFYNMGEEIWKPVEGYEGRYEVSNMGRVKSLAKNGRKDYILHPVQRIRGRYHKTIYRHVQLVDAYGNRKWKYAHILVARAFIPNPENKPFVDHILGTEYGDCVKNLRWCTGEENIQFDLARRHISEGQKGDRSHWYGKFGRNHSRSKPVAQYAKDGTLLHVFDGFHEAARQTGILQSCISSACAGRTKSAGGYIWKYVDKKK